jgi:PilZ domain
MDYPDAQPNNVAIEHDRRRYPRCCVQVQIELHLEGSDIPLRLETTDLSRGGCYIQLMMTLPVGALVKIKLWLDGLPIVLHGRIVTCHPQFGNGIMFVDFEGQAQELLSRYIDSIVA